MVSTYHVIFNSDCDAISSSTSSSHSLWESHIWSPGSKGESFLAALELHRVFSFTSSSVLGWDHIHQVEERIFAYLVDNTKNWQTLMMLVGREKCSMADCFVEFLAINFSVYLMTLPWCSIDFLGLCPWNRAPAEFCDSSPVFPSCKQRLLDLNLQDLR